MDHWEQITANRWERRTDVGTYVVEKVTGDIPWVCTYVDGLVNMEMCRYSEAEAKHAALCDYRYRKDAREFAESPWIPGERTAGSA